MRLAVVVAVAVVLVTSVARADDEGPAESSRSVKLFDTRRTTAALEIDAGPLWNRRVQDTTPLTERTNFQRGAPLASEIGAGIVQTTPYAPFFLRGVTKTLLRVLDGESFSWALLHQEIGGGIALGPLGVDGRFRVSILSVDVVHAEWSVQTLSPGASAGISLALGKLHVDARLNADYLWRWFGPDYVVRSFTIGLRLDVPKPRSPFHDD
jgi:hypothetical protein